jgi:hypothetical protein
MRMAPIYILNYSRGRNHKDLSSRPIKAKNLVRPILTNKPGEGVYTCNPSHVGGIIRIIVIGPPQAKIQDPI